LGLSGRIPYTVNIGAIFRGCKICRERNGVLKKHREIGRLKSDRGRDENRYLTASGENGE
jgi:hypothetical protein